MDKLPPTNASPAYLRLLMAHLVISHGKDMDVLRAKCAPEGEIDFMWLDDDTLLQVGDNYHDLKPLVDRFDSADHVLQILKEAEEENAPREAAESARLDDSWLNDETRDDYVRYS